jgi:hypothetical protein
MRFCKSKLHYYDETAYPSCRECKNIWKKLQRLKKPKTIRKLEAKQARTRRRKNPERHKQQRREYTKKNRDLMEATRKAWVVANRETIRRNERERRKTDIQYRIKGSLRAGLRTRMKRGFKNGFKGGSAVKDLGCSMEDLKKYLESRFQPGMSWKNYGNGKNQWSIDHIIPLASVDLTDRESFLKVCNYTNLQPLWFEDHVEKTRSQRNIYLKTRHKKN